MILYRLDYWLILNNPKDSVSVTNIIPSVIKTHHAAISLHWILILVKTTLKVRVTGK